MSIWLFVQRSIDYHTNSLQLMKIANQALNELPVNDLIFLTLHSYLPLQVEQGQCF